MVSPHQHLLLTTSYLQALCFQLTVLILDEGGLPREKPVWHEKEQHIKQNLVQPCMTHGQAGIELGSQL